MSPAGGPGGLTGGLAVPGVAGAEAGLRCGSGCGVKGSTAPLHPPCSSWSCVCNLGVSLGVTLGCPRGNLGVSSAGAGDCITVPIPAWGPERDAPSVPQRESSAGCGGRPGAPCCVPLSGEGCRRAASPSGAAPDPFIRRGVHWGSVTVRGCCRHPGLCGDRVTALRCPFPHGPTAGLGGPLEQGSEAEEGLCPQGTSLAGCWGTPGAAAAGADAVGAGAWPASVRERLWMSSTGISVAF